MRRERKEEKCRCSDMDHLALQRTAVGLLQRQHLGKEVLAVGAGNLQGKAGLAQVLLQVDGAAQDDGVDGAPHQRAVRHCHARGQALAVGVHLPRARQPRHERLEPHGRQDDAGDGARLRLGRGGRRGLPQRLGRGRGRHGRRLLHRRRGRGCGRWSVCGRGCGVGAGARCCGGRRLVRGGGALRRAGNGAAEGGGEPGHGAVGGRLQQRRPHVREERERAQRGVQAAHALQRNALAHALHGWWWWRCVVG